MDAPRSFPRRVSIALEEHKPKITLTIWWIMRPENSFRTSSFSAEHRVNYGLVSDAWCEREATFGVISGCR
jgi:hypothetical protein